MPNIFEVMEQNGDVTGKNIFKDKRTLDHRFLPDKLVHREDQIREIAKYWIDALNNITPSNVTLYGKTGTGKTAASKFAAKQLLDVASKKTYL